MEEAMNQFIAALCLMLGTVTFTFAQEKAKDAGQKTAPVAEKAAKKGDAPKAAENKNEATEKQKAQQSRMKDCTDKAGERKGDDRKRFMSSCLKGEDMQKSGEKSGKGSAQQDRMKACNLEAGEKKMKGDERKAFMKECLAR
jgi:psiF repeat